MLPVCDLPRERLARCGPLDLTLSDLLGLVLGRADGRVARSLVERFPDLRRMAAAGIAELAAVPGVGPAQACRVKAALALAGRLGERPFERGDPYGSAAEVHERIGRRLAPLENEVFLALAVDVKNRVLTELRLAEGGACSVPVIPRDLFARVVREAAAGVIFVHNHPSGDPRPSDSDRELTARLGAAADLVGVKLIDHVISSTTGYFSFTEEGNRRPR
jgi:DNA repair protein RadC